MTKLSRLQSALPTIRQSKVCAALSLLRSDTKTLPAFVVLHLSFLAPDEQGIVLNLINDPDVSIRKRALEVLFVMGDENNAQVLVKRASILRAQFSPDYLYFFHILIS